MSVVSKSDKQLTRIEVKRYMSSRFISVDDVLYERVVCSRPRRRKSQCTSTIDRESKASRRRKSRELTPCS
jgi:hypothetical protein